MQAGVRAACRHYTHRDNAVSQIVPLLETYAGNLYHEASEFTYDDGRVELLMCLTGVLPVPIGPNVYHCPVSLWLPLDFPSKPPMVYVVPSATLAIKPGPGLDPSGKLSAPYLDNWQVKPEGCTLLNLVEELIHMFSARYPVVARAQRDSAQSRPLPPRSASPPRPPPPTGLSSRSSPMHVRSSSTASTQHAPSRSRTGSPPRPPPPPGYGAPPAPQTPVPAPRPIVLHSGSPSQLHSRSNSLRSVGSPPPAPPPLPPPVPPMPAASPPHANGYAASPHPHYQAPTPVPPKSFARSATSSGLGSGWTTSDSTRLGTGQSHSSSSTMLTEGGQSESPPLSSPQQSMPPSMHAHALPLAAPWHAQTQHYQSTGLMNQAHQTLSGTPRNQQTPTQPQFAQSPSSQVSERSASPTSSTFGGTVPYQSFQQTSAVAATHFQPVASSVSTAPRPPLPTVHNLASPPSASPTSPLSASPYSHSAQYQPASSARPTKPARGSRGPRPVVNILDSDENTQETSTLSAGGSNVPSGHNTAPPPVPPNPAMLALRNRLHAKLSAAMNKLTQEAQSQLHQMDMYESDLLKGEPAILDEMQRLTIVKQVCANVRDRYKTVVEEGEKRLQEYEHRGDGPEPDEIVCSSTIVYNQLLDLVAEDAALEDTIYQLGRGLNTDSANIDLDRFLKRVRGLAREQFLKRALINKILLGLAARQQHRSGTPQQAPQTSA
ncbi:Suppressor protein stp22 of temperature-sensitive alpha-factor receptor and arginine permease [Microbotryomycetes sp. JL221]|nr:Suppressor protein stp22 of temperature-sensitive alpha-factor receptor and arginine permease [Microbotryomycetes sp. JL221]